MKIILCTAILLNTALYAADKSPEIKNCSESQCLVTKHCYSQGLRKAWMHLIWYQGFQADYFCVQADKNNETTIECQTDKAKTEFTQLEQAYKKQEAIKEQKDFIATLHNQEQDLETQFRRLCLGSLAQKDEKLQTVCALLKKDWAKASSNLSAAQRELLLLQQSK